MEELGGPVEKQKENRVEDQSLEEQNVVQNHVQLDQELEAQGNAHNLVICSQIVHVFTTYSDSKRF